VDEATSGMLLEVTVVILNRDNVSEWYQSSYTLNAVTPQGSSPGFCFSGDSTVEVKDKGAVAMKDVEIGDQVLVGDNKGFEPIYSFGFYALFAASDCFDQPRNH
jgi:hypothetical protein